MSVLVCYTMLVRQPIIYPQKDPIIPLGSDILALTPICPFRPRNRQGALIKNEMQDKI